MTRELQVTVLRPQYLVIEGVYVDQAVSRKYAQVLQEMGMRV